MKNGYNRGIKPWRPWLAVLGGLVIIAAIIIGVYTDDRNFQYTNETITTECFPSPTPVQTSFGIIGGGPALSAQVWLDVRPNMKGFINERGNSIKSTYLMLLKNLKITTNCTLEWHWFNNTAVGQVTEDGFQDLSKYEDPLVYPNKPHGIGMVLDNASLGKDIPTIIFTDLEGHYCQNYIGESALDLQNQLQQKVFEQGLSIRVDRYVSAYSGTLKILGNGPHSVYYGEDITTNNGIPVVQVGTMFFHPQPRAFYVLTIGTAAQCEEIGKALAKYYDECCLTLHALNDSLNNLRGAYIDHHVFRLYKHSAVQVARLVSDGSEGITVANPGEGYQSEPIGSNGVVGFSFVRSATKQGETLIRLNIPSQDYTQGASVPIKCNAPTISSLTRVDLATVNSPDPAHPELYLHQRGPLLALPYMADASDARPAFTLSLAQDKAEGFTLHITVDHRKILSNLYRIAIPVFYTPDVDAQRNCDIGIADALSISTQEYEALYSSIVKKQLVQTNDMLKTLNLWETIRAFYTAYSNVESATRFQLADILFDLRID